MESTGTFEISENDTLKCSGSISVLSSPVKEVNMDQKEEFQLTSKDVYKELRLRGYEYDGKFRGILNTNIEGIVRYILIQPNRSNKTPQNTNFVLRIV